MAELTISIMQRPGNFEPLMRQALETFEKERHVKVHLRLLDWATARSELNRVAFTGGDLDISEVGTTWLADLALMNTLLPLSMVEIGSSDFAASSLKTCQVLNDLRYWGFPWVSNAFVIHYRRDILDRQGIAVGEAFASLDAIETTARRLSEAGVNIPIQLPLHSDYYGMLHCMASYVWASGGDFTALAAPGRGGVAQVIFDSPQALEGMTRYFNLLRYLSPAGLERCKNATGYENFRDGYAAVLFSSQGAIRRENQTNAGILGACAIAPFPGGSFIGGSDLVIWKRTHLPQQAIEPARYLTDMPFQSQYVLQSGELPARLSVLAACTNDPILSGVPAVLHSGRIYPTLPLWGTVEDRLLITLQNLWGFFRDNPDRDLEPLIRSEMQTLARRLNVTLSQYNTRAPA